MPLSKRAVSDRDGILGGSDAAAVCGVSPWKTVLELWAEKSGLVDPPDLSDNESVQLGTRLEEPICKIFQERTGLKVRRKTAAYVHPEHEFLIAHVDRVIEGGDAIVEAKNTSDFRRDEWVQDKEVPIEVIYQTMWNMGLAGAKEGYAAALIGGNKFRWCKFDFDQELFDMMIEKAVDFMRMVKDKIPPMAVYGDDDILAQLFPGNPELDEIDVPEEDVEHLSEKLIFLDELKAEIKVKKEAQKTMEVAIKQYMEDSELMKVEDRRVTWKSQTATRVDVAKLKEAGLFDEYSKETEFRVLRIGKPKKNKEKE